MMVKFFKESIMIVSLVDLVMNLWQMETLILEDLKKEVKWERVLTTGFLQIKCTLGIGWEVYRMEKENTSAIMAYMKGISVMV